MFEGAEDVGAVGPGAVEGDVEDIAAWGGGVGIRGRVSGW